MRFILRLLQAVGVVGVLFAVLMTVLDTITGGQFGFVRRGFGGGGPPPAQNAVAQALQDTIEPARGPFYNLVLAAILFVLCEIALTLRWHVYRQHPDDA